MGLLDMNFPGNDTAEGQGLLSAAMSLLSAQRMPGQSSSLANALGQAGQQYMRGTTAARDDAMKRSYMQSQIDENTSQNEARKLAGIKDARMQKMQESFMNGDGNQQAMSPGAFSPSVGGMGPTMPLSAPQAQQGIQGGAMAYARSIGIPEKAIQSDMAFNGGKGIADMMFKRGAPDMQVTNGYAYDKNGLGAGYLPSLSTSQDGKTSMVQIGSDGMPTVSAPRGSLETFGGYQGTQASFKPIKVYNPDTKREEYTNEGAVVGRPTPMIGRGNIQSPGYSGGSRDGANTESIRMIQSEMNNPALNAGDKLAMNREITRLQTQSPGIAAGPSAAEKSSATFGEKLATEQADMLGKSYTGASDAANDLLGVQQARKAVASGAFQGSGADFKLSVVKFGAAIGVPLDPNKAANTDYLKSVLGQGLLEKAKTLGSNPSNADASRISDIVGSIGKDPNAMNKILDWRQEMATRSITLHNGKIDQATTNGYQAPYDMRVKNPLGDGPARADASSSAMQKLPIANASNKGRKIRDTETGKVLVSNGMSWTEAR